MLKFLDNAKKGINMNLIALRKPTKAKWTGIRSIDMGWLAECNEVHVDPLFGIVKEFEHESEICLTRLVDLD